MSGDSVNWLLVGTGDIVRKRVAAALSQARGSRIVGICARNRERLDNLAGELEVDAVFTDYEKALATSGANAVYLATPVNLHIPQAVAAMNAGKHVLVEKPMGLNGDECLTAARVAKETGVTAGCAYYRRFYPRFEDALRMVRARQFGRILLVRLVNRGWHDPAPDDPKRWRLTRSVSGGGPLADVGSHMLDMMIGLFGLPAAVFAKAENLVHDWEVEDSALALMSFADGAHALATFQWNAKPWSHELEIVGTDAALKWLPCDTGAVLKTRQGDVEETDMPNAENVHLPLVEDFVDAVLTSRAPRVPLAEALKTNVLMDAIYESSRTGEEIRL